MKLIEHHPTKDPTNTHFGRPRKDIDWSLFENLCAIQCTRSELASFLKVDQDTLITAAKKYYEDSDFSEIYKRFSENGKCSLRRYQFVQAKTKPNMAIWLGKQWLNQKDNDSKDIPQNDPIISALLDNIKNLPSSDKILDLTKANQALQDQVNALQKQLEALNARQDNAGSRTDDQVL